MSRKFTWDAWNFDDDGNAYIIAKSKCPKRENVPNYIIKEDRLHQDCTSCMVIEEGWCKFQVRPDWFDKEGPRGWYVVVQDETETKRIDSRRKPGWFEVWVVRKGEWY